MNRDEKEAAVKEISSELESAGAIFAVDYRGISVPQAAELRSKLRDSDASFSVVKNRLAKRATDGTDAAAALDEHLVGPTALTFVRGDAVVAAKTISDFMKAHDVLAYKGGLMDGAALAPDQFNAIAKLPGVETLRGQLVGLAASPLSGVVRTLNQLLAGLAQQLGQVAEQGLVTGEAPAAEPEAEAAEEPAAEAEAEAETEPEAEEPAAEAEAETTSESEDEADQTPAEGGDDADADAGDEKED
ncbi:MAG TPA: 50S ribosomal protein L10 [Alphaproteobacteria bacterium]|nr:50S ribosomal protein L10 [Alphaproteobacteria bacterium]